MNQFHQDMLEFITCSFAISTRLVEDEIQMLQYNVLNRFLGHFGKTQYLWGFLITRYLDIIHRDHALLPSDQDKRSIIFSVLTVSPT